MTWPIAVISFNRPALLEQLLRGLREQTALADPANVFLFQDGGPEAAAVECAAIFERIFPQGRVFLAEDNLGIALNIDRAERFVFETLGADCGIFFEDDLLVGPVYLTVLNHLIDIALADERIGYVAAFGNHQATPEQQLGNARKLRPLHLLWGFGLTKRHWLRCRPYVEQYLEIARRADYRARDHVAIRALCASWGVQPGDTAQDRVKSFATALVGAIKLNTEAAYARYVGAVGTGFTPDLFKKWGFGDTHYFSEVQSLDFDLSTVDFDPWSTGNNVWKLAEPIANSEDVRHGYRLIFGREPESDAVVQTRVGMPLSKLRGVFLSSAEFKAKNRNLIEQTLVANGSEPSHSLAKLVEACQRGPTKIVIGAGPTRYDGWCETNVPWLDLRRSEQWDFYFSRHGLRAAVMEHVLEHLTPVEAETGLRNVYRFLLPGSHLRIAVPDGNFPDPAYIEWVRPGGSGAGAKDHQVLWTIESLSELLQRIGFETRPLEYFQRDGVFVEHPWAPADGPITRSRHNDKRNSPTEIKYTSLIVDAVRP